MGEGVIIMGDLNRPLQAIKPSFDTNLLKDWEESGQVIIMNDKDTHTRFDPCTGKGSTLDVGVISLNIKEALVKFSVDTEREEMEELLTTGASYKDVNKRIWKMKEIACGPMVGPTEPACINNPMSIELITDKETIKNTVQ